LIPGWLGGALLALAGLVWLVSLRLRARVRPWFVLAIGIGLRLPFLFSDFHSDDVYRYVWEGRVQRHGVSPYQQSPDHPGLASLRRPGHQRINHPDLPSIYPPLAQAMFRGAAGLGMEEVGFKNLMLLLDMVVLVLLFVWLRSSSVMAYAWAPVAIASPVGGHIDPLMLVFLVGCAMSWERGRPLLAGGLLGAAVLAKLGAVVLLPWMLVRRPRAALVALVVVLVGYAPYGFATGSLLAFGRDFEFNASLYRLFGPWSALLLAGWIGWVVFTQPRIASAGVQLIAGLLLFSPTVHFWYLSWFLVLLPATGLRRWTEPLLLWCVTITATCLTYAIRSPWLEFYSLTALEYALPLALGVWLAWRAWPRRIAPVAPVDAVPPRLFGVVIPCRGEAENLRELLPRFPSGAQVVVADTPTGDETPEICAGLDHVRYLRVVQRGYGAAVGAGLASLSGEVEQVVICDADHACGPEQLGALLAPLQDPRVGLVTAARTTRLPLAQRFGNGLACLLIGFGWRRRFVDLGPFRALQLPGVELADRGFGWNVEMNVAVLEAGREVVEVALPAGEREHGENRISGTLRGVFGAGVGILHRLYRLREQSCRPRLSS